MENKKIFSVVKYEGNNNIISIPANNNDLEVYEIGNYCFDKTKILKKQYYLLQLEV